MVGVYSLGLSTHCQACFHSLTPLQLMAAHNSKMISTGSWRFAKVHHPLYGLEWCRANAQVWSSDREQVAFIVQPV